MPGAVENKEVCKSLAVAPTSSPGIDEHQASAKNETSDKSTSAQSTQPPPKPKTSNTSKSGQQRPSPEIIRRVKVKPVPSKSPLPKKVRFAMDMTSSTESLSSSSGRSDASYIDPPATVTPTNLYSRSSLGSNRPAQYLPEPIDRTSDSDSDDSAIDCGENEFQRPTIAPEDVHSQNPHVYGKLGSSFQRLRQDSNPRSKTIAFSFPSSSGKLDQPIFVYRKRGRRGALSKKDPIFILRESSANKKWGNYGKRTAPGLSDIHDAKKSVTLTDAIGEHKPKKHSVEREPKASLYKPPVVTDEADEAVHYDPALRIFWRDA